MWQVGESKIQNLEVNVARTKNEGNAKVTNNLHVYQKSIVQ